MVAYTNEEVEHEVVQPILINHYIKLSTVKFS